MTVIEQTDSGENFFIRKDIATLLSAVKQEMIDIKTILELSHNSSESLKRQAQEVLESHAQNTANYTDQITIDPPPDFFPFTTLPEGSSVRDLPDGTRLFTLSDGMIIKTLEDNTLSVITTEGEHKTVTPGPGTSVEVSTGRSFELLPEWTESTQENVHIEGLPASAKINQLSDNRYDIDLPPYRMLLDRELKTVSVINPSGSINILGHSKIHGVGETPVIRILADDTKGFICPESGHGGLIRKDGTIHLTMKNGSDLVMNFSDTSDDSNTVSDQTGLCTLDCQERVL